MLIEDIEDKKGRVIWIFILYFILKFYSSIFNLEKFKNGFRQKTEYRSKELIF